MPRSHAPARPSHSLDIRDILFRVMAKVLVSIDDALLRQIDRAARKLRLSRSAYLAQIARDELARSVGPGKHPAVRSALGRMDTLLADTPAGDSTAVIRAERDAR